MEKQYRGHLTIFKTMLMKGGKLLFFLAVVQDPQLRLKVFTISSSQTITILFLTPPLRSFFIFLSFS